MALFYDEQRKQIKQIHPVPRRALIIQICYIGVSAAEAFLILRLILPATIKNRFAMFFQSNSNR
jgi:hypothetical protein